MCGIIGYIGSKHAVPLILNGLEKLEYRGYDSAGLAVCSGKELQVIKKKGRLNALKEAVEQQEISGHIGIGHTRWATHGEPSHENAHPHLGGQRKIAVVHNGIIENYKLLKEHLQAKGVEFASDTDSEVVAQLAEHYYKGDIMETVVKVANALEGSYALGILCIDEPDKLFAVRKDSPLIVGVCPAGNFIASDVPAILEHTRDIYYLEQKQIAVLESKRVSFYNMDLEPVEKERVKITWDVQAAEKSGYEHFMFKEIMEQPKVLKDTFAFLLDRKDAVADKKADYQKKILPDLPDLRAYHKITIIACGSAYNAGMVGKYVFEELTRTPVEVDLASEFRYRNPILNKQTLAIVLSQSGETADTIAAMREAQKSGLTVIAIVNVIGSTIAKEADYTIYTHAGPEIAVATTKALSAQLCVIYLLALKFAQDVQVVDEKRSEELFTEILALPEKIEKIFLQTDQIQQYAASHFNSKSIFFIGRNIDYAIAMEGSLKLKEISYIHSEAYAGGELKHGTISLIEEDTLVVAICCCDRLFDKLWSNIEQVISRGAKVLFLTNERLFNSHIKAVENADWQDKLFAITVPDCDTLLSPSLSVVVLQLFSYYVAANKGCDIDKPRNLAKSVTVE